MTMQELLRDIHSLYQASPRDSRGGVVFESNDKSLAKLINQYMRNSGNGKTFVDPNLCPNKKYAQVNFSLNLPSDAKSVNSIARDLIPLLPSNARAFYSLEWDAVDFLQEKKLRGLLSTHEIHAAKSVFEPVVDVARVDSTNWPAIETENHSVRFDMKHSSATYSCSGMYADCIDLLRECIPPSKATILLTKNDVQRIKRGLRSSDLNMIQKWGIASQLQPKQNIVSLAIAQTYGEGAPELTVPLHMIEDIQNIIGQSIPRVLGCEENRSKVGSYTRTYGLLDKFRSERLYDIQKFIEEIDTVHPNIPYGMVALSDNQAKAFLDKELDIIGQQISCITDHSFRKENFRDLRIANKSRLLSSTEISSDNNTYETSNPEIDRSAYVEESIRWINSMLHWYGEVLFGKDFVGRDFQFAAMNFKLKKYLVQHGYEPSELANGDYYPLHKHTRHYYEFIKQTIAKQPQKIIEGYKELYRCPEKT